MFVNIDDEVRVWYPGRLYKMRGVVLDVVSDVATVILNNGEQEEIHEGFLEKMP